MNRIYLKFIIFAFLTLSSTISFGLTSTCGLLYAPPIGEISAAHRADWNMYTVPFDDWVDVETYIVAPNGAGGAFTTHRANTLGTMLHYWINVVDGAYTVDGSSEEYYYW